ncbi:hypothetical protein, partial [Klebsiella pneumoniae]|uniref:hypothetical protein n=1 Tax=Klebsiella pneumoniae TaxID=573 RepID=UPI0040556B03
GEPGNKQTIYSGLEANESEILRAVLLPRRQMKLQSSPDEESLGLSSSVLDIQLEPARQVTVGKSTSAFSWIQFSYN